LIFSWYTLALRSFGGERIWNFGIKPPDGAKMLPICLTNSIWGKGWKFRGKEVKWRIWTPVYRAGVESTKDRFRLDNSLTR